MMKNRNRVFGEQGKNKAILSLIVIVFFAGSCNFFDNDNNKQKEKPELLVDCGITMINPMQEVAEYVEKEKCCIIRITKGVLATNGKGVK